MITLPTLLAAAVAILAIDVVIRMYRANKQRQKHDYYQSEIKGARRW